MDENQTPVSTFSPTNDQLQAILNELIAAHDRYLAVRAAEIESDREYRHAQSQIEMERLAVQRHAAEVSLVTDRWVKWGSVGVFATVIVGGFVTDAPSIINTGMSTFVGMAIGFGFARRN